MTTLKDVAQLAGVSTATVSYVLNGKKRVTPDVLERVQQAVQATGYRPNTAARALRTGQTFTFGLIVPDITNPFFPQLAQAIEARAKSEGYVTVLVESGYEAQAEADALDRLTQQRVDGVIWTLSGGGRLPHAKPSLPIVVLDYAPEGWSSVRADDYGGGRMQARLARDAGHGRVLLLWGQRSITSIQERRRGFLDEAAGSLAVVEEIETNFSFDLPRSVERRLLARRGEYSMIVCGNDVLAIGAMRSLKRAGVDVPGEVSVVGFDDTLLSELVDPPLTTVAQPIKKLGALAVEQLLRLVRGHAEGPNQLVVPVSVRERGSVRRLNDSAPGRGSP